MNLSSNTLYEIRQLAQSPDREIAKLAVRVYRAGTREVLAANTELHSVLLGASSDADYQRDVRADIAA